MGEIEANYGLLKEGILRKSKAKGWFFLGQKIGLGKTWETPQRKIIEPIVHMKRFRKMEEIRVCFWKTY